ncbi:MAG: carboxymuconolactone decarboxylase family protein [Candidatus Bathyarchaeota archaeon]|nr:carboxymuconolactone decarboxylase family protein [Candidatus Bathyarchaeota archaeon]
MTITEDRHNDYVTSSKMQELSPEYMTAWNSFMEKIGVEGALSSRRKELIAVSLSIASKCDWCIRSHVQKALDLGGTKQEIIEAAWIAVLMGGDPVLKYAQWAVHILEEYLEIYDEHEMFTGQVQLELENEYKKLHEHLLDYVNHICEEVEELCDNDPDRKKLALNIAETDGNVLSLLITKECHKRGWGEPDDN